MAFSGLGAGTIGDPYRITTIAQFNELSGYDILSTVFNNSGLNDLSASAVYTGTGDSVYTVTINGVHGILGSTLNNGGAGFAVNDLFTVDGGTAGYLATGKVLTVNAGVVLTYSILTYGSGYAAAAAINTTPTSGSGTGLKININSLQVDSFKWKKDNGTEVTALIPYVGGIYTMSFGVKIAFGAQTGHTLESQWVISNTANFCWKLMNNLDFGNEPYFYCLTLNGQFDGNGFSLNNLITGNGGFGLKDGSAFHHLTMRYNRKHASNTNNSPFNAQARTYSNITLSNVHIIAAGTAILDNVNCDSWNSTCVINNIVCEGAILGIFPGTISCLIEHVKVFRNGIFRYSGNYGCIVGILDSIMRYCQVITPMVSWTSSSNAMLVQTITINARIRECFVVANITTVYANDNSVTHGMIEESNIGTVSASVETVEDCYFRGNLNVNRGNRTYNPSIGKSGYTIASVNSLKVRRCYSSGDVNTPLNTNRTILVSEYATSGNNVQNCYYNQTKLVSIVPKNIAGQQNGLTTEQFLNAGNFAGWDFATVWEMGGDGPVLRNNPLYAFELDLRVLSIVSVTRSSTTQVSIMLSSAWEFDIYGVDVFLGETLIYNAQNTLSNLVTVSSTEDNTYVIKAYWLDNGIKNYKVIQNYFHYCKQKSIDVTTIAITNQVSLVSPLPANYVHGSCLYGAFMYGSTRNKTYPTQTGSIVKVPIGNVSAYTMIPILVTSEEVGYSCQMENIVACGDYLYAQAQKTDAGVQQTNLFLIQFNPANDTYKVFLLAYTPWNGGAPIATDGTHLYLTYSEHTYKVNPSEFIGNYPKFNVSQIFSYNAIASYNHDSQGGHILGGYSANGKGYIHSICVDGSFMYLNFSTQRENALADPSGYSASLNKTLFETHKVNVNTMLADSWLYTPKATDDSCITATHLFLGIEVQPAANTNTYGYGWGTCAIRKSDLRLTWLTRLHSLDTSPAIASYASLIFGNYLLDSKTNGCFYIIDISDVDNWVGTEPIGSRTLNAYSYKWNGITPGTINEILLPESGTFHGFLWAVPSNVVQLELPGLDFFTMPTVNTIGSSVMGDAVTLTGFLLNTGGKTITGKGFHYGTTANQLTGTITSGESSQTFHAVLSGLDPGVYYYKSFAINSVGESINSTVMSFTVTGKIFIGATPIKKVYKGGTNITKK